jgi:hypothetical protein
MGTYAEPVTWQIKKSAIINMFVKVSLLYCIPSGISPRVV